MPNAYANLILRYGDKFVTVDIPGHGVKPGGCIFPGGTVDQSTQIATPPDSSMRFAALREFDEETHPVSHSDLSFKDLLASKGLSFADMDGYMSLVGAMDNEHENGVSNPGLHAYYELDLKQIPAFSPPKFTEADFDSFSQKLSPQDDLKYRKGTIKVRDLSELKTSLLPKDQFKGGLRATLENICSSNGVNPQITHYDSRPGQQKKQIKKMDAQWEQDSEKKLHLAPKHRYQPTAITQTAPFYSITKESSTAQQDTAYYSQGKNQCLVIAPNGAIKSCMYRDAKTGGNWVQGDLKSSHIQPLIQAYTQEQLQKQASQSRASSTAQQDTAYYSKGKNQCLVIAPDGAIKSCMYRDATTGENWVQGDLKSSHIQPLIQAYKQEQLCKQLHDLRSGFSQQTEDQVESPLSPEFNK